MHKPADCIGCSLANISDGFSVPEGEGTNGIDIVGEALGYNEYIDGLPFRPYAQAGSKLEEAFKGASRRLLVPITRSQFRIGNVVWCHPPGDKLHGASYEHEAIRHCRPNLQRMLFPQMCAADSAVGRDYRDGRVVFGLGAIPLRELTGFSGVEGEKQSISYLRGYVFNTRYGRVVPSFHPSYVKRGNDHLTPLLIEDLTKAIKVQKGEYRHYHGHPEFVAPRYQTSPSVDDAWGFYYAVKDRPRIPIAYDIETVETAAMDEDTREELRSTDITLVQFSIGRNTGIAMPWEGEYIKIALLLLALPNPKVGHNVWNFDNPILESKGVRINGVIHDTMWMFKHWHPQLPRGLQAVVSLFSFPFPWKHLYSANLNYYGCADVDAVQYILAALPKLMQERGVWEGYKRHVCGMRPILVNASKVGIPVNPEKHTALGEEFRGIRRELDTELQKVIPDVIRNIKPRRKDKTSGKLDYGYIHQPKQVGIATQEYAELLEIVSKRGQTPVTLGKYIERKCGISLCDFVNTDTGDTFQRWARVEPFKASKDQLVRYLKWKKGEIEREVERLVEERQLLGGRDKELTVKIGDARQLAKEYEVPRQLKTKKETTGKKELEEMFYKTGDRVLEVVMKIRSIDTNLNNYLPNWQPSSDGRVHTTWLFTPPQGQLVSVAPNILNCSKHTEYGQRFRGIIEAPPGYTFVEFDKKSFHVGTFGYCINSRNYIRYSQLDPHSILGSHIAPEIIGQKISLKWSDDEIRRATKEFKKRSKALGEEPHGVDVRQALAKPTVLGNQLGLGPWKLQRQNRRFIHYVTKRDRLWHGSDGLSAEELQAIVAEMFPDGERFKEQIKEKAFLDTLLINEFGRIQYFFNVFAFVYDKKQRKWVKKDGDGAREPVAFRVQGTAFGMITEESLLMHERELTLEHNWINSIHDSVMFMPEERKKDKCIEEVYKIMSGPCRQLVNTATGPEGLRLGVDVSVGRTWREMKEIKV